MNNYLIWFYYTGYTHDPEEGSGCPTLVHISALVSAETFGKACNMIEEKYEDAFGFKNMTIAEN